MIVSIIEREAPDIEINQRSGTVGEPGRRCSARLFVPAYTGIQVVFAGWLPAFAGMTQSLLGGFTFVRSAILFAIGEIAK